MTTDDRPTSFSIAVEPVGDAHVVAAVGELDVATADRFAEALDAAARGGGAVVVDLCRLGFMDSTGLHALLRLRRRLERERRGLALACGPLGLRRLFALTGMDAAFAIYETPAEALAALRRGDRASASPLPDPSG